MAQHDYVIDNASGATVRADINSALSAIQTLNSGTSAPSSTAAGMLWLDTTGGAPYALKIRDAGNNHWLTIGSVTDPGADGNLSVAAIEGSAVLSTGESGGTKFLREDGDGSCSFQNVTQEMVFLEKFTASSTAEKLFNLDSFTSYNSYVFILNAVIPATDGANFLIQLGTSTSSIHTTLGDYRMANVHAFYDGTTNGRSGTAARGSFFDFSDMGNNAGFGTSGTIHLFNPTNSSMATSAKAEIVSFNLSEYAQSRSSASYRMAATDDAVVKFVFNSGNIASGTISLYGLTNA